MTLRLRSGQAKTVTGLITSLTLWDVVAMNIVAVVGLRWISRSARLGAPSVTLWILACLLFFVPLCGGHRRALQPASRTGRHLRVGAARVRTGARLRVRLVHVGQQPVLLSGAAAVRRREHAGAARGRRRRDRRQPLVLGHVRARVPVVDDVPQHPRLLGRQVDSAHRQRRDVDSRGAADRRRRDCVRDVRQRDVVRAV